MIERHVKSRWLFDMGYCYPEKHGHPYDLVIHNGKGSSIEDGDDVFVGNMKVGVAKYIDSIT